MKYQKLQGELDYFRAARQVAQLRELERELSTIALSKADHETDLFRIQESVTLGTHEHDFLVEEVRDIDRQISEKSGPEYIKLLADLEAERGNILVAKQTIGRLKKEKDRNLSSMNDIFIDMKKFENSIADKNKDFCQLQIDLANLAMEYESQKNVLDQVQELMEKKSKDSEGAQTELIALMVQIEEKKAERSSILSERNGIIERSRIRVQESERIRRQKGQLVEERGNKQAEIDFL